MEYTILNTEIVDNTTYTLVRYNIEGNIVEVNIAHFQPKKESDIIIGIENRYKTEEYKIFPERMPPIPVYVESPVYEPENLSLLDQAIKETEKYSSE